MTPVIESGLPAAQPGRIVDVLVVAAGVLTGLSMTGLTPVLPAIANDFGAKADAGGYLVKAIVAVVGLSIMLAAPLADLLARRYSASALLIVSFGAYSATAVASALAPSLGWLVTARFLQGLSVAIGVTLLLSLTSTLYHGAKRNRLLGLHVGSSALALLVLLPLAGVLGERDWRLAPLLGLISVFHLALAWLARGHLSAASADGVAQARAGLEPGELSRISLMVTLSFLIGVSLYSGPAFVPFKLAAVGVASSTVISLFGTLGVATSAMTALGYGLIARRISATGLYALALGLCAFGGIVTALAAHWWQIAVAQLAGGIGGGMLLAHIYADNARRFRPELRGRTTGLVKSSSFAGLFVGPLALQAVAGRSSLDTVFWVLAGIALCALTLAVIFRDRHTISPSEAYA